MKRKKITVIGILGVVLAPGLLMYAVWHITGSYYRRNLPADLDPGFPKPVVEQVAAARRNVAFFTTASAIGQLGLVYNSCLEYKDAAGCYKLAAQKNNSQWIWNYYLGYLCLEQGESAAALRNFRQVMRKDPSNVFALYYAAEACRNAGSTDTAASLYRAVIAAPEPDADKKTPVLAFIFPLKTYALFQLARIQMMAGRTDSAAALLKEILAAQETFGPAYRSLAAIYSRSGDTILANKYTVMADDLADYIPPRDALIDQISLLSRSDQYLLKQIEDALRSRNGPWALELCNHALRFYPDNKELISTAVFENFREGNDTRALSYLDKHFDYFNNDAKELMDLTDLLYNRQHLPEAIRYFNQVKKLLPEDPALAGWLSERGKNDEAIAMMSGLLEKHPDDLKIVAGQIRLLLDLGEEEQAGELFARLAKKDPAGIETFRIKGRLAEKKGFMDSARLAYEAACRMDPGDLIFTRQLIAFYISQNQWQQAIDHFKRALGFHPNEPSLLEGFGRLLVSCPDTAMRNTPEGIEYTKRAMVNYRSPTEIILSAGKTLATVYLSLGDKHNCVRYANKTIALAKEVKQQEAYLSYFRTMVSR